MELKNWALIRRKMDDTGGLVLPQDYNIVHSYALGEGYGRQGFEDGKPIVTSKVVGVRPDKIITVNGSEYKLGEMHPDYEGFIEAYKKGVPILKDWGFICGKIYGHIFRNNNYEFIPDECEEDFVEGEVVSQDLEKNLCTLATEQGNKEVYVDWLSILPWMCARLKVECNQAELQSLLPYAGKRIKFDMLSEHREIAKKIY